MESPIIFISGWMVPKFLEKTSLVWDDKLWKDYSRIYLPSKTPTSDAMVKRHLEKLSGFINNFESPIIMGQSLGAWWAANLACLPNCKIKKLVLMLPIASFLDLKPIFNASQYYYPFYKNTVIKGPHKVLVCGANNDLVVPCYEHADRLSRIFDAMDYKLNGGHFLQKDHTACLNFIKDWIEI